METENVHTKLDEFYPVELTTIQVSKLMGDYTTPRLRMSEAYPQSESHKKEYN